ncbi:hypothetical protein B4135_0229 [Caldibacillus debilis]|uniref:Uncharacterized protein n=1 Tax=Caldibacillus debilis TaxID=301148 RepID=A0A150M988_9BACI|nr:hypothetical protein B4135_0229 [Caldibacillus debilis]
MRFPFLLNVHKPLYKASGKSAKRIKEAGRTFSPPGSRPCGIFPFRSLQETGKTPAFVSVFLLKLQ